jgi:hypothetical protein
VSKAPEHRAVGFDCVGCGDTFETALGYKRHRSRCTEIETNTEAATEGGA